MDTSTLPADYTALIALLANPLTFGAMISIVFEQLPFIQDPKVAGWKKLIILLGVCLGWAFGVSALQGTLGNQGIYKVIMMGVAVAMSTQLWHVVVIQGMPALAQILALFGAKTTAPTVTVTTGAGATTTNSGTGSSAQVTMPTVPTSVPPEPDPETLAGQLGDVPPVG